MTGSAPPKGQPGPAAPALFEPPPPAPRRTEPDPPKGGLFASLFAWRNRIYDPFPAYGISLGSLLVLLAITYVFFYGMGFRSTLFGGVLMVLLFLVILGSAWLGYGPGILVCAIVTLVLPHVRPTANRGVRLDFTRFALVLVICLLVSRLSQTRRRRESELLHEAEILEERVRRRTEESVAAVMAVREAEERFRFVLDSAGIGYWDLDLKQNTVARSRKHDELFGHAEPLPHWDSRVFLDHVHPDDRPMVEQSMQRAVATGETDSVEFRIVWPDQSIHWIWLQGRSHRGADGNVSRLNGVIMDITERKRTEEDLRDQAQLLDLAHDAILSMDRNSSILFWSHGAEKMYGYSRGEAVGQNSHDFLKTKFPAPLQQIESTLLEKGYWAGELTHTRRDGATIQVASRWALRRTSDGKPAGILEINTDITERLRMEQHLRHTQKLESLGVLAGGVAHDFNNLLTGILGNASLALDGLPPMHSERIRLEEVIAAAERAADLTRQLLAYAGKGRFVMRTVNLSDLVREISGLVQTSISKHVQLRLQLADGIPAVEGDPGQLQQIIMNLVINGAEAIGPQGGTVLVRTAAQAVDEPYIKTMSSGGELLRVGNYVCLEVHDTGCGMSPETLAKIFDPFFTTKFTGRGLGLSAVLGIVRAHKGSLKVYSKPGEGTTFKVLLPASSQPASNPQAPFSGSLAGKGVVLVVDDEEVVRRTAKSTLERYGYEVWTAPNGAEALEQFRRNSQTISMVLLDLTMPIMSGEETLRQMQIINPAVRVLLTSGYNEVEAVQRFAGKGLAGFIQKPFSSAGLAEKVKSVLAG